MDHGTVFRTLDFAESLASELSGVADVSFDERDGLEVNVLPTRAGARSIWWYERSDEVVLSVGEDGGRWELAADEGGLGFLEDVVRSTIAGRISEVLAPGRSRVVVVLADGTRAAETGYSSPTGCFPLPFWPRWSRTVRYLPYR